MQLSTNWLVKYRGEPLPKEPESKVPLLIDEVPIGQVFFPRMASLEFVVQAADCFNGVEKIGAPQALSRATAPRFP
jgi:hypothetical protein